MKLGIRGHISYANVAATLALVFSMSGGALAATHYLIDSTKQISPKVLKQLRGDIGPSGAAGPAGAVGPAGSTGSAGPTGTAGATGPQGPQGPAGAKGTPGTNGSPWTDGGTLPSKATETGSWGFSTSGPGPASIDVAEISFPIRLAAPLSGEKCEESVEPCHVHYINSSGQEIGGLNELHPKNCPGSAEEPLAEPGNLCVYDELTIGVETEAGKTVILPPSQALQFFPPESLSGAGTAGAVVFFTGEAKANLAYGSWAVTEG
jgi:hypothetical protein